jgi:hypothetical protein
MLVAQVRFIVGHWELLPYSPSHAWRGALSVDPICDRDAVFDGSDASRANEIKRMSTVNPAFRPDLRRLLHQRRRRGAAIRPKGPATPII